MSKVKFSISLLAMLVISLYTAVAFAAPVTAMPTGVKAEALSLTTAKITFTGATGATAHEYQILSDATPVWAPIVSGDTITFENITGVETVLVEIRGIDGADLGPEYEFSFYAHNPAGVMKVVAGDNDLPNANQTGVGDVIKAKAGHAVHGSYQNNTNSCASCHQTHTAAADALLFKTSKYETCIACHDGTMGFFNVFETDMSKDLGGGTFGGSHAGNMSVHLSDGSVEIGAAPGATDAAAAGSAGWDDSFSCVSCHDPHGSYSSRLLTSNPNNMSHVDRSTDVAQKMWFGNNLNDLPVIDGTAWASKTDRDTAIAAVAGNYRTAAGGAKAAKFKLSAADVDVAGDYVGLGMAAGDWVIQLYRWDEAGTTAKWVPTPFLQHGGNSGDGIDLSKGLEGTVANDLNDVNYITTSNGAWKGKVNNSKASAQPGWVVNGARGYVKVGPLYDETDATNYGKIHATTGAALGLVSQADVNLVAASITHVTNVQAALVTKFPTKDTGSDLPNGNAIMKTDLVNLVGSNYAIGYNTFCGQCHVDYNGGAKYLDAGNDDGLATDVVGDETGVGTGTQKFFHHMMNNSYTCVRCHFAHGTDVNWMLNAAGQTVAEMVGTPNVGDGNDNVYDEAEAQANMVDVNASSALKRYTNMSVCYGCHTSSHSEVIVNSGTYAIDETQVNGINVNGSSSYFYDNVQNPKVYGTDTNN